MMPVLLEIMRPGNCLMAGVAALIGLLVADPAPESITAAQVFLAVFAVTGAGNAVNDFFDREIDAVNRPRRPIPRGAIAAQNALILSLLLFAGGCALAYFINTLALAIGLFNSALLYLYARNLKATPLAGNLSVGYLTGSTFLFGGAAGENAGLTVFLFLLASLATVSREIEKDVEDMEGDRASGARTFPIVVGEKMAHYLAALFVLVAIILSYLAPLGGAYLAAVSVADLLFLVALGRILQGDATKAQHLLKGGMAAALMAFLVAAVSGFGYL
jgi:geranylgeranylglycerol-phosphate geranylgeranyltransferase